MWEVLNTNIDPLYHHINKDSDNERLDKIRNTIWDALLGDRKINIRVGISTHGDKTFDDEHWLVR